MKTNKTLFYVIIIVVVAIVLAIGLSFLNNVDSGPGVYDELAQCLSQKGVIFYGAFWCPHCAAEKKMFGNSVKYLPYHECSTPDAMGQTQECITAKIQAYPTWQFPDGTRISEVLTPEQLAKQAGCMASLPPGDTTVPAPIDASAMSQASSTSAARIATTTAK